MKNLNYLIAALLSLWGNGAFAQFSGTTQTGWINREGPLSIGRTTQYSSGTIDLLHIDNGGLRIGKSTTDEDRKKNMIHIGDSRYIGIGEWYADDHLAVVSKKGYNFVTDFGKPYYDDIFMYVVAQYNDIGLAVRSEHREGFQYGFISAVNRDDSKGIAVVNTSKTATNNGGEDVFRVYGNGNVECKKVKVAIDIWADFVFDKNYDLPTLQETERYIQDNGHLPNLPNVEEVKENGFDLGEMNRLLLQKVEELTLYTIEQQKQLDKLSSKKSKRNKE